LLHVFQTPALDGGECTLSRRRTGS